MHRASIGETWRTYTDPWSIKIAYSTALPSMNKSSKRGILAVLLNEWMNEWIIEWMNERIKEWIKEWKNECIRKCYFYRDAPIRRPDGLFICNNNTPSRAPPTWVSFVSQYRGMLFLSLTSGGLNYSFKCSVTWSCVSLPRSTASRDWKLLAFKEINHLIMSFSQIESISPAFTQVRIK